MEKKQQEQPAQKRASRSSNTTRRHAAAPIKEAAKAGIHKEAGQKEKKQPSRTGGKNTNGKSAKNQGKVEKPAKPVKPLVKSESKAKPMLPKARPQSADKPMRARRQRTPLPLPTDPNYENKAGKGFSDGEPRLRIIPLGGLGEVGKNMTVFEWGDSMIVVDCGLCFPREDLLGVDYVIPDTTYLEKNRDKLKAFVITHGHEDHIGATPYVLKKLHAPVYGTRLTLALIESKFAEHGIASADLRVIKAGDSIQCGVFRVEFIKVSHSIDDAVGLAIHTPVGVIVHTGDFKIDYTPVDGKVMDLAKFSELGRQGVLALLSESTNAETPGSTISERSVGAAIEHYFPEAKGRIIIATFASNIHRLQQIVDLAKRYGRKVCLSGRSMVKIAGVASELGYLKLPEKMQVSMDDLDRLRDDKVLILTTGSQGEPMSGLVRMAAGEHSKIAIKQGDLVIISSSPIPGNEKYVSDVISMLYRRGANVVYGKIAHVHVSGHACQEELKMMLAITRPKYFIPIHGEYRHLYSHALLAEQMGIKMKDIFISEIGKPIELSRKKAQFGTPVPSGSVLIDGLGIGDVGTVVLRDRQVLSSDGLFIVVVTVEKRTGEIVTGPEVVSRGFVYVRESEDLLEKAKELVVHAVRECAAENRREWMDMKGKIKKALSAYLYHQTKRSPMILPIIIEV